ncbi:phage head closure protein [Stappia sp. F7233]|uniref:Phage head closure protein n=1 Tax=Stappia albiluteola TaxID=2758565 RepID=A0A839AIE0_9HYPH|nr:phage head closure protein [Stappia albiluteola]MBA5779493.1 phage head closure protein [Stappia albiluteola]
MARAGQFRDRVTFQTETDIPDSGGGQATGWADIATVWAHLVEERGRERIANGRIEASAGAVLRVRHSPAVAVVTESDRAVIGGVVYNIRSIAQPDRRNRIIEMVLERGVAV